MNEQKNQKSISEEVLLKIEEGNIKMKPKIRFIIKLSLLVFGAVAVIFFALFVSSFIFFTLRMSGILFLPEFGFMGFKILFFSLPWILIFGLVALIATSELFIKHFSFVYKKPILYSVLIIVLLVFLGGFILDNTGFHTNLFKMARSGKLPMAEPFYKEYGIPKFNEMHYGIVFQIEGINFKIKNPREEELLILTSPKTKMPGSEIKKEDALIILGKRNGNTIKADAVGKTNRDLNIFPKPPPIKPF